MENQWGCWWETVLATLWGCWWRNIGNKVGMVEVGEGIGCALEGVVIH
jgi:hypothetical protein